MATVQYGVSDKGFVRKPLSAILDSLNSRFLAAFGATFDISPESPDGQVIGIVADEASACWAQSELSFNAYRPGAVGGIPLDNICELTNTKRFVNKHSSVTVSCSGGVGTVIPEGSLVSDGTMQFALETEVRIPGSATATAVSPGEYYVAPNTVVTIVTKIAGWTGVTNADIGQTGVTYEEDPALRARRDKTTALAGSATVEAIYAGLADMNLQYLRVRDNDTGAAIGAQPAGTVWIVVDGGTDNDIGQRVYRAKTGGVPTFGTTSVTVSDSKGYPHVIKFSRSTATNIFVKGTFKRRSGSNVSSNDAAKHLQDASIEYLNSLQPGQSVIWSAMFGPLMSSTLGLEVDSLFIGIAANPTRTATIDLEIDKRAHGVAANISFTDVTT